MTSEVMGAREGASYRGQRDDHGNAPGTADPGRKAATRLAGAASAQPARPLPAGGRVHTSPELRRDRSFLADEFDDPASFGAAGDPLRERNALLLAGGYAPAFAESALDSPPMSAVNDAINAVLDGHSPYPAVVVDRHWELVAANEAIGLLTAGAAAHLLEPPVNVLRLSLHPEGMAPRILNLAEWRAHLLHRLAHQAETTGDPVLSALHAELATYPGGGVATANAGPGAIVVPLRYRAGDAELSLFSTTTVFGTPLDVTVAELAIEAFYPADPATAEALRRAAS